jgi:hypothetical protein
MNYRFKYRSFRVIGVAFILFLAVATAGWGNEISAVWSRLYQRATTLDQKLQMMINIVEQHDRDMIPVLTGALDEQVRNLRNLTSTTERVKSSELSKMVVKELGKLKTMEAASLIWEVVQAVDEPFLKGEALIALSRIGARQYGPEMALMLRNINFNYDDLQKQRENETLAFALILSLERLGVPEAYEPIFFASIGWYSSRSGVKERAKEALSVIVDDPTEQLLNIMERAERYGTKQIALEAGYASKAPAENKAALAVKALDEGLRYTAKDGIERRELKSLRLTALNAIRAIDYKDPAAIDSMEDMLIGYQTQRLYEEDETLTLLSALGSYSDDKSARALANFLNYQTERREVRASESLRIVKATIQALGRNGSRVGFEPLTIVTVSSFWESSVQREAKAALEKLGN